MFVSIKQIQKEKYICSQCVFFKNDLLSSDLQIQTYMIKVHVACQNYQKLQVQLLWHEMICMDYVFHAGSGGAQIVYYRM